VKQIMVEQALSRDGQNPLAQKARSVRVNLAESPLGWLHARGLVTQRQMAAGENLRRDYERGALPQRTVMTWDAPPIGKTPRSASQHGASTLAQIDARDRFHGGIAAAGPGLGDILWRVVCAGESVPVAEQALGWPTRAGRLVLALALDRVADYYKING
jgi:hypothetical protein